MATQAHFGGSLTRKGRLSRNPSKGTQFRTEALLERLVRFDIAKSFGRSLITDAELGKMLSISTRQIAVIRGKAAYLRKRMELTTGISTDLDGSVNDAIDRHRAYLKDTVPLAMRALIDALMFNPTTLAEKKFKLDVAREIMDREGSFPKISRTDSHVKVVHDYNEADGVSKDILDSLGGAAQSAEEEKSILKVLQTNRAFSNSETLTRIEQEAALASLENMTSSNLVN